MYKQCKYWSQRGNQIYVGRLKLICWSFYHSVFNSRLCHLICTYPWPRQQWILVFAAWRNVYCIVFSHFLQQCEWERRFRRIFLSPRNVVRQGAGPLHLSIPCIPNSETFICWSILMPRKISSFLAVHTELSLVPLIFSQISCYCVLAESTIHSFVVSAIWALK